MYYTFSGSTQFCLGISLSYTEILEVEMGYNHTAYCLGPIHTHTRHSLGPIHTGYCLASFAILPIRNVN